MRTLLCILAMFFCSVAYSQKEIDVTLHPDIVENHINKKLYGALLEHINHSVSNDVWGEMVWNRSFEETYADGEWSVDTEGNVSVAAGNNASFIIGNENDMSIDFDVKISERSTRLAISMRDQMRESMPTNRVVWSVGDTYWQKPDGCGTDQEQTGT